MPSDTNLQEESETNVSQGVILTRLRLMTKNGTSRIRLRRETWGGIPEQVKYNFNIERLRLENQGPLTVVFSSEFARYLAVANILRLC